MNHSYRRNFPPFRLRSLGVFAMALCAVLLSGLSRAAADGSGAIEGRVFNETSGNYVNNARVTIATHRLETFTDEYGQYRFTRKFAVYVSGRNINEAVDDTVIYGPSTPPGRSLSGRADYRAYWNVGLKGTF